MPSDDPSFTGTWVIQPELTSFNLRSPILSLDRSIFRRTDCRGDPLDLPADGADHEVKKQPLFDAMSVREIDAHRVEIVQKRTAKAVWKGWYTVSADGQALTLAFEDDRSTRAVTGVLEYTREGQIQNGAHLLTGTWKPRRVAKLSPSGRSITIDRLDSQYALTVSDGRSAVGTADARPHPLLGYLPGATVSLHRLSPDTVQINRYQDGETVEISRLKVADGGASMTVNQIDWVCQSMMVLAFKKKQGGS